MKKVITLALALVLLVAFAAPAAALVPDNALGTTNSSARFSLSLQLASAMPVAGATLYIPEIPANKAWVTNEILYFVGQITAFKDYVNPSNGLITNKLAAATAGTIGNRATAEEAVLRLTGTGVSIYNQAGTINWMRFDTTMPAGAAYANAWRPFTIATGTPWSSDYSNNWITMSAPAVNELVFLNAQNTNYLFYGYGFVTGAVAQPSVKAEIKMTTMIPTATTPGNPTYIGINKNYVLQKLAATGNPQYMVAYCSVDAFSTTTGTRIGVKFTMDSNTNKCIEIAIGVYNYDTSNALNGWLLDTSQGTLGWRTVTKGDWYDGANYIPNTWLYVAGANQNVSGAELTALTNVFSFMGFDYALLNTNAVLAKDFIAKIDSTNIADTATATLYAGTPPITDPPTGVTPPKTGDSASILGFVMIGMAIVAAAGVAYRKVRA